MKRNGFWVWVIGLAMVAAVYVGAQYVRGETVCGKDVPKTWQWSPPQWECHKR